MAVNRLLKTFHLNERFQTSMYTLQTLRKLALNCNTPATIYSKIYMISGDHKTVYPVKKGTKRRKLFINLYEKIFGLPESYTDAQDLNIRSRRQLLGNAWSVQTVEQILTCLKAYFQYQV